MKNFIIVISVLFLVSCSHKSTLSKEFGCKSKDYPNLEKIQDFKKVFTVQYPDTWKTNLYYDKNQSSIYTADTTKQLTETMLLDITHVSNKLNIDANFIKKFKSSLANNQLLETGSGERKFKGKMAYYSNAIGKKGKFDYKIYTIFIKLNENNYIHSKIEVYGDSLADQRICNGINLIEKITY